MNKLYLNEAMKKYNKRFEIGQLNLLNAPAGSGKTTFIFNDLLKNTNEFADIAKLDYCKDAIIYVCDTSMLKDSVLLENADKTKVLGEGAFKEMVKSKTLKQFLSGNFGKIIVITYSTLGWLLKSETTRGIINKYCKCLVLDEVHNLYKYMIRYDTKIDKEKNIKVFKEDGNYVEVVDNLSNICKNVLTIAVSATINSIEAFYRNNSELTNCKRNVIFTKQELSTIREYNFDPIYTNCIMNQIKEFNSLDKFNKHKTLIYTNTIKQSQKYKNWFEGQGISAEWLCSINNKKSIEIIDEETGEVTTELIPTMSEDQLALRNKLLHDGILPKDLQVLIVNGSYETGWNLRDKEVQMALIDSIDIETQIQARNRIRHDIQCLVTTCRYDKQGYVLTFKSEDKTTRLITKDKTGSYERSVMIPFIAPDNRFLGVKLTPGLKREIKELYAMKSVSGSDSFSNYIKTLDKKGYVIKATKNGTYIYKNEKESSKTKRSIKKMNKLETYLNKIAGVKLDKKAQQKLIKEINLEKNNCELQDKIGKLNEHLRAAEYNYVILSKSVNGSRFWIVEYTEN